MPAVICTLRLELTMFESASLKDKRAVVRRVRDRVRHKFNVAVAEVGELNDPSTATLSLVTVSNAEARSHATLQHVISFIEDLSIDAQVSTVETETIHL